MKTIRLFAIFMLICLIVGTIIFFAIRFLNKQYEQSHFVAQVEKIHYGNVLQLSNGSLVDLIGIRIPDKEEENYRQKLTDNIHTLLIGKKVTVTIKVKLREFSYHNYPLAVIHLKNGTSINQKLLEEGMAFFDHGYYPNKEKYEELEREAKNAKKGIWRDKNTLTLLYVTSKDWWNIHYPDCPEVGKIKPEDRIEYYFELPPVYFYRGAEPQNCPYCGFKKHRNPPREK